MTLENLVGKTLERIEPQTLSIAGQLDTARRNIADAHVRKISAENRFDADCAGCAEKMRNVANYSGDIVPISAVNECVANADCCKSSSA